MVLLSHTSQYDVTITALLCNYISLLNELQTCLSDMRFCRVTTKWIWFRFSSTLIVFIRLCWSFDSLFTVFTLSTREMFWKLFLLIWNFWIFFSLALNTKESFFLGRYPWQLFCSRFMIRWFTVEHSDADINPLETVEVVRFQIFSFKVPLFWKPITGVF